MAELYLVRRGDALYAADPVSQDVLERLSQHTALKCEVKAPRNLQWHRKFFALVTIVFENQELFQTKEHLVTFLKVATGHADWIETPIGEMPMARSISFAAMDGAAFAEFWDRIVGLVCTRIIPGMDPEALESEVGQRLASLVDATIGA